MNKKKAKILVIGKDNDIQATLLVVSPHSYNPMPKRITNLQVTIIWYPFIHQDPGWINSLQNHPLPIKKRKRRALSLWYERPRILRIFSAQYE